MKPKPLWPEAIVWDKPDGSIGIFCWSEEQADLVEPIGSLVVTMARFKDALSRVSPPRRPPA